MLFKPLLAAGTIVVAFGIICIWIGTSVVSPKEDGEGFKIIGIRFLIGGIVSITLAFIVKYFMLIKYLLKQISYKGKSGDKYSDWHKPWRLFVSISALIHHHGVASLDCDFVTKQLTVKFNFIQITPKISKIIDWGYWGVGSCSCTCMTVQ